MTENKEMKIIEMLDQYEIPYIKIKILFNFTDHKGKLFKKKPFFIPSYNKKTDTYYNTYNEKADWMEWNYEECIKHNKNIEQDHTKKGINALNVNLTNTPYMIIDIDSKELLESYLNEYGNYNITKSTGRGLPHLWRRRDKEDKNTTKTSYKEGLDLIYTNSFEFIDSKIKNYSDLNSFTFKEFPKIIETKKKLKKFVVKKKTESIDSGLDINEENYNNDILEIEKYLNIIPNENIDIPYDEWLKIIFSLKNDNINNLDIALKWSQKSKKHDDNHFNEVWNYSKDKNTIGTLYYYANKYNAYEYRKLKLKKKIDDTDDNLSKIYLELQSKNIVYSNEEIYLYKKNWVKDDKKTLKLKKNIRVILQDYFLRLDIEVNKQLLETDEEELTERLTHKKKKLNIVMEKIRQKSSIDNICSFVIQDLAELFSINNIIFDLGEEQKFNLHFKNGVYEIRNKKFRPRTQEDYITQYLDWDYKEKVSEDLLKELDEFYSKLQPDEEQKKFSLEWMAYNLTGTTGKQKFKMNIGYSAGNGKSTEFKIHDSVFDIYSFKLDTKTFNEKNDKRHKQLIHLIKNPIRFSYCEELQQSKLDVDFIKDFVDGSKLNCEIMYGTSESHSIQAKLTTCSNKDFNIDIDKGILRRGLVQFYESKFRSEYTKDNKQNNTYKLIEEYEKRFLKEEYKNAYLHLLLNNYKEDFKPPKNNAEAFKDIANEYDEYGSILNDEFIITDDKKDCIYKDTLHTFFKDKLNKKSMSWRVFLSIMKGKDIKYNKSRMVCGERGQFEGIKVREQVFIDED